MHHIGLIFVNHPVERPHCAAIESRRNWRHEIWQQENWNAEGASFVGEKPIFAGGQRDVGLRMQGAEVGQHHGLCPADFGARDWHRIRMLWTGIA